MRERSIPGGVEFLDEGRSRKAIALISAATLLAICYWFVWPGFRLLAILLAIVIAAGAAAVLRFVPQFFVRLNVTAREASVEWSVGPNVRRRLLPFTDIVDVVLGEEQASTSTRGGGASIRVRPEFVLRDGSRVPWLDHHVAPSAELASHQSRALALIRSGHAEAR